MKESLWGYWLVILGLFVLVVMMLLQNYTTTTYNNLYLLGKEDYDKYSKEAITRQLYRFGNTYAERELCLAVEWLKYSLFYEGDYVDIKNKEYSGAFIKDGDKHIQVKFKTYFFEEGSERYE